MISFGIYHFLSLSFLTVLRHWLANKIRGKILVTSSLAAVCEFPFVSHYAASKKALNTFYRDLNLQYSTKGITAVNCMPGGSI